MNAALQKVLAIVTPRLNFGAWSTPLDLAFAKFGFNTPRRVAAAVGQFLVEAGRTFGDTVENLDYTSATHLAMIFPNQFVDAAAAAPYVNVPETLANYVYAGRNGNGGVESGDGWLFRGRGLIQITGRNAYTQFAAAMNMSLADVPAWCETPTGAAMSGCWYLTENGCLPLADAWEITAITRKVNGSGMDDAAERLTYSNYILQALEAVATAQSES